MAVYTFARLPMFMAAALLCCVGATTVVAEEKAATGGDAARSKGVALHQAAAPAAKMPAAQLPNGKQLSSKEWLLAGLPDPITGKADAPCLDYYPDKPITEADLRKANFEAFVLQVVRDEDKRVLTRTQDMVKKLIEARRERARKEAAVEAARLEAQRKAEEARRAAAAALSQAAADVVERVARDAAEAGRKAQLAEDRRVLLESLKDRARVSAKAARDTHQQAIDDRTLANATAQVTKEIENDSQISLANAERTKAKAHEKVQEAKAAGAKADRLSEEVHAGLDSRKEQVDQAVTGLGAAAGRSLEEAMDLGRRLEARREAPQGFLRGLEQPIAG